MSSTYAQKKKKNPYDDYWKQQEQEEKFNALVLVAHDLFQKGELEKSKEKYQEALPFKPDDQETIAKIRDIKILLEKEKILERQIEPFQSENKLEQTASIEILTSIDSMNLDSSKTEIHPEHQKEVIETVLPNPNSIKKEPVPIKKSTQPKKTTTDKSVAEESKTTQKTSTNSTHNYQSLLGEQYPEGWTEEITQEKTKTSTKRVFVKENIGNEYVMVKHHYGAIYYFKNGKSISYATWSAETSTFKESK